MNGSSMRIRVAAGLCTAALLFGGCSDTINDSATLVNIDKGKDKIELGYGNFVAHFNQAQYDEYYVQFYGNTHYWSQITGGDETTVNALTNEESVKGNVMDELKENYLSAEHAPDFNVEITDDESKKIEEAADRFMSDNSEDVIKAMGANKDYLVKYMTDKTYAKKLRDAIEAEGAETIKDEDVVQTSYSYVHLYVDKYAENPEEQPTDEELKATAEAIAASDDLDAAAKEHKVEVDNDTFTKAMSAKDAAEEFRSPVEVIKAVKALKNEGDMSGVIPVEDDGYYVVRLDHLEDKDETEAELDNKITYYYSDMYNAWVKELEWEINEKEWAKVTFDDVLFADVEEATEESEEAGTEEASDEESADGETEEVVEEESDEEALDAPLESDEEKSGE